MVDHSLYTWEVPVLIPGQNGDNRAVSLIHCPPNSEWRLCQLGVVWYQDAWLIYYNILNSVFPLLFCGRRALLLFYSSFGLKLPPSTVKKNVSLQHNTPAMLGFLAQGGWLLGLGGFSTCSSSKLGVWLHGGGTWPLQSTVLSLGSTIPRRRAARRCCWWSRNAHTSTIGKEK